MVCFLCGQTLTVDLAEEILEFSIKIAFFFPLHDECKSMFNAVKLEQIEAGVI